MAAVRPPTRIKTPTSRIESVEFKVERPVYFYYFRQPTETEFAQTPNVSKLAGSLFDSAFFIFITESFPVTYPSCSATVMPAFHFYY